ncbi:hypothetical protein N9F57_00155 [Gammaproteobacteria bacterium]|nr:hypothetical protein [Gammaproteobacteria bacterium]
MASNFFVDLLFWAVWFVFVSAALLIVIDDSGTIAYHFSFFC